MRPPQTTRAKLRGDFIRAAQEHGRDFTVDWVHLKLNDQAQRTVLCKDPFRSVDERVERLMETIDRSPTIQRPLEAATRTLAAPYAVVPYLRRAVHAHRVRVTVAGICPAGPPCPPASIRKSSRAPRPSGRSRGRCPDRCPRAHDRRRMRVGSSGATGTATTRVAASAALKGVDRHRRRRPQDGPEGRRSARRRSATKAVEHKVLTPGTGTAATKADTVRLRGPDLNGTSGKLSTTATPRAAPPRATARPRPTSSPGFTEGLRRATKVGSRVAFAIPPDKGFGAAGQRASSASRAPTRIVVRRRHRRRATRPDRPRATARGAGATAACRRSVTNDRPRRRPITVPKTAAPTKTQSATADRGHGRDGQEGPDHRARSTTASLWKDGSVFDSALASAGSRSTSRSAGPGHQGLGQRPEGKKVGSRVLLVIPPADGYGKAGSPPKIAGNDTLVFVVDILAAY